MRGFALLSGEKRGTVAHNPSKKRKIERANLDLCPGTEFDLKMKERFGKSVLKLTLECNSAPFQIPKSTSSSNLGGEPS